MVSFGLEGVRRRAKTDKTCCLTALLHQITLELLRQSFYEPNRNAAPRIDSVTWQDYEKQFGERLPSLLTEIHNGCYRTKPVLRIPFFFLSQLDFKFAANSFGIFSEVCKRRNMFSVLDFATTPQKSYWLYKMLEA